MGSAHRSNGRRCIVRHRRHMVHPASSHMFVSEIKQCMSKHKLLRNIAANGLLHYICTNTDRKSLPIDSFAPWEFQARGVRKVYYRKHAFPKEKTR